MTKKMIIDAAHAEETRVVVLNEKNIVEEFDFESTAKTLLRGNIYLAKVARIEPSLQAAFVDYGGNRHGFLAFNEIHPDYYQIPTADREALLEAEAAVNRSFAERDAEDDSQLAEAEGDDDNGFVEDVAADGEDDVIDLEAEDVSDEDEDATGSVPLATDFEASQSEDLSADYDDTSVDNTDDETGDDEVRALDGGDGVVDDGDGSEAGGDDAAQAVVEAEPRDDDDRDMPSAGALADDDEDDALRELRRLRRQKLRGYKIQEVIKKRQIILVQVVKEERGNKGAALTTYLSLAGRYCVLMPNTGRGGGISRKIGNVSDRRRLREVVDELNVPPGMGLIIRTAGSKRTKSEIKRDYEHLLRLWENVRKLTLESIAPSLVYEEGSLVKRAIRDLYSKDIDEVVVEGDEAYKDAKSFMRMLMPSHAKNVKHYKEPYSLFQAFQIEKQLDATLHPVVQLKSGGYLVINPTEALVSIDVNSGRSTRERSVEHTALHTNLEAAEELARQCRLRDLAGLIVVDFIDMEENRNNRAVERRLKDAMKRDRARVQIGRISNFGLMEMSRQRMRSGVLEGSSQTCSACNGTGIVRSNASTALRILRGLEEICSKNPDAETVQVSASLDVAVYLLNEKRAGLSEIEQKFGIRVIVDVHNELVPSDFEIVSGRQKLTGDFTSELPVPRSLPKTIVDEDDEDDSVQDDDETGSGSGRKRRRRRRGRRGRDGDAGSSDRGSDRGQDRTQGSEDKSEAASDDETDTQSGGDDKEEGRGRRRRGRRGGRRRRRGGDGNGETANESVSADGNEASSETSGTDTSSEGYSVPIEVVTAEVEVQTGEAQIETDSDGADPTPAVADTDADQSGYSHEAEPFYDWNTPSYSTPESEQATVEEPETSVAAAAAENNEDAAPQASNENDENVQDASEESGKGRRGWWQKRIG